MSLLWCILAFSLLSVSAPSASATSPPRSPLVILLLPGTSLSDWERADAPHLHQLLGQGAVAVMNTRTARMPNDHRREPPESAALTLGAGSRAAGGMEATDFHPATAICSGLGVPYGVLFRRRTTVVSHPHSWVDPLWPRVIRENTTQRYDLLPGNLGDTLRARGMVIQAGGGRLAFPVACCSNGTALRWRPADPLPDCLIYDAGSDLKAADVLVGRLSASVAAAHGQLWLLSPFAGDAAYARGERLAPLLLWGTGVAPGLVYSASTHQAGLVTDTDLAPSVVKALSPPRAEVTMAAMAFGRPWEGRPSPNALASVQQLEAGAYQQSRSMRLLPAIAIALGLLLFGSLIMERLGRPVQVVSLTPIGLVLALAVSTSPISFAALSLLFLSILYLLQKRSPPHSVAALGSSLLTLLLLLDMVTGNPLMRHGMLGYSAVEGARYYGIGNEAMGALVGAALAGTAGLWTRGRFVRIGLTAALGVVALSLGSPLAGAKVGGLLVAVPSFAVFLWSALGFRWTGRVALGVFVATLLLLCLLSLTDLTAGRGDRQTHLGRSVARIRTGGLGEAGDVIGRKMAVEGHLLYHSAWAIPLWITVLGLWSYRRRMGIQPLAQKALFLGGNTAIAACLTLNDAGVVAGTFCGVLVLGGLLLGNTRQRPRQEGQLAPH